MQRLHSEVGSTGRCHLVKGSEVARGTDTAWVRGFDSVAISCRIIDID